MIEAQIEVPAKGHVESIDAMVEATCTKTGLTEGKHCEVCGEVTLAQEIVPVIGHTLGEAHHLEDETCTEDARVGSICAVCGAFYDVTTILGSALGHDYVTTVTPATCLENEFVLRRCSRCDQEELTENQGTALGHDYVENVIPATCLDNGFVLYRCSRCDQEKMTENQGTALGHDYVENIIPATCLENEFVLHRCRRCDQEELTENQGTALGHDFTDVTTPATCSAEGKLLKHCERCGYEEQVGELPIDPDAHHVTGEYIILREATCAVKGVRYRSCDDCNTPFYENYFVPHTETVAEAVAPTCTETGLTEGKRCEVCGEALVKQEIVPALGHTEVIDPAVAPTADANGLTEGKHCSACGEVLVAQKVVPALGHTEVIDPAVAPTCTETGLTEGIHCSECGEVLVKQEIVPSLGHAGTFTAKPRVAGRTDGQSGCYVCGTCGETLVHNKYISASSVLKLPAALTIIEEEAFTEMKVQQVVIPEGVTEIGSRAFADCAKLRLVIVPDGLETFAEDAFANCPEVVFVCSAKNEAFVDWAKAQGLVVYAE